MPRRLSELFRQQQVQVAMTDTILLLNSFCEAASTDSGGRPMKKIVPDAWLPSKLPRGTRYGWQAPATLAIVLTLKSRALISEVSLDFPFSRSRVTSARGVPVTVTCRPTCVP